MPAIDQCEPHIIKALEKAGWQVTHHPFPIRISRDEGVFADLRLRHRDNKRTIIVVEVKCFSEKRSLLDEFYHAVGQYLLYRNILTLSNIDVPLYLSVPSNIHSSFFRRKTIQAVVQDAKIRLIVVDMEQEEIVKWLD
jgi:XisH protein